MTILALVRSKYLSLYQQTLLYVPYTKEALIIEIWHNNCLPPFLVHTTSLEKKYDNLPPSFQNFLRFAIKERSKYWAMKKSSVWHKKFSKLSTVVLFFTRKYITLLWKRRNRPNIGSATILTRLEQPNDHQLANFW